ncbi:MAG TPA: chemotaxis-specific protein-glutamate methyltransferase CheB [Polyangiaceae bacterium]|jgi:two-component system chemotaxis response regulator CheB
MNDRIRTLIVDDSAFARKVLRGVLGGDDGIEIVGTARDGLDALEKIGDLAPDVVTLDLVMPNLDGVGVLRALQSKSKAPPVVIVSMADDDSDLGVAALAAGAFDVVKKPTALATDRLYELADELRAKVRAAARARPMRAALDVRPLAVPVPLVAKRTSAIVIGTSTGGPQALSVLLRSLPAEIPVPIAIVLHMPTGYTEAFANRLDGDCALEVMEARDGLAMKPGRAIIARAGLHLVLRPPDESGCVACALESSPSDSLHRPSVDVLFESATRAYGAGVLGVVLTGMGNDGTRGSLAIAAAGGRVLTEAAASCIVYGMPRAVVEAGASSDAAPLEQLASLILRDL